MGKLVIYLVTNKITGEMYVGQTSWSIHKRWLAHCKPYSGCTRLKNAIQKYGSEQFWVDQIDSAKTREELNIKEIYWIQILGTLTPKGYNLDTGGWRNFKVSKETREKQSNAKRGKKLKPHTEETKRRISESNKKVRQPGSPLVEAISERMKGNTINKGKKYSKERVEKVASANKGKKRTPEQRQRMREAQLKAWAKGKYKDRPLSGAALQQHLDPKGRPHTEEAKAKMRGPRKKVAR
jgi:group I intron endonuclease